MISAMNVFIQRHDGGPNCEMARLALDRAGKLRPFLFVPEYEDMEFGLCQASRYNDPWLLYGYVDNEWELIETARDAVTFDARPILLRITRRSLAPIGTIQIGRSALSTGATAFSEEPDMTVAQFSAALVMTDWWARACALPLPLAVRDAIAELARVPREMPDDISDAELRALPWLGMGHDAAEARRIGAEIPLNESAALFRAYARLVGTTDGRR